MSGPSKYSAAAASINERMATPPRQRNTTASSNISDFSSRSAKRSLAGAKNASTKSDITTMGPNNTAITNTPATTTTTTTTITKKARSKRMKQSDNRSTITTTTDTLNTPVNVYDAVLGEAEDLLQAACEAQALGRLKMASAYQLLLHARLVGLGKRFDRAQVVSDPPPAAVTSSATAIAASSLTTTTTEPTTKTVKNKEEEEEPEVSIHKSSQKSRQSPSSAITDSTQTTKAASAASAATAATASVPPPRSPPPPPASPKSKKKRVEMEELSKYLPSHVELDSTMMEHLARVAMELHHQKTGRKIHSDNNNKNDNNNTNSATTMSILTPPRSTVAWTEEEKHQCQSLMDMGYSEHDIAQRISSRTEAQVRAFLANNKQRQKEVRVIEQDFGETDDHQQEHHDTTGSTNTNNNYSKGINNNSDGINNNNDIYNNANNQGNNDSHLTPRKKGRGRKPPTQAMNTVPNANLDAKKLLSGKALG